jgi:anti-anti-sigma factor
MKIDASREGGSTLLQLEGRLDREGAERLSDTLDDLLHDGVRSLSLDFSRVTYASSAVIRVLARWHQELTVLRGDVQVRSLSPAVRDLFAGAGWEAGVAPPVGPGTPPIDRRSYWHARTDLAASGQYELSSSGAPGTLTCRMLGDPERATRAVLGPDDCNVEVFPNSGFGIGLGAIGRGYDECHERLGELIAVAGCVAYFPSDGARLADYLLSADGVAASASVASGLICEGSFSQLMRFAPKPEAGGIPLSELAGVALDAVGGGIAGLVIVGETAGLCGARLRRSPADGAAPLRFELPGIREWLSFAPERIHPMTTTLIAGVVARSPRGPIAAHLRPHGPAEPLYGHLHAAVFSYHPLPQRTVELDTLVRGLFTDHQLRDVLHLLWDDRVETAVGESTLVRGVGWMGPITQVC